MADRAGTRGPPLALANLFYLAAPLALAWQTSTLSTAALIILPVLSLSWFQDWRSCAIADDYYGGRLALFDIVTAANYVALARALELPASSEWTLSKYVFVQWGIIFVIYITWNLRLARDGDRATKRMMYIFSLIEVPAVALAGALVVVSGEGHSLADAGELLMVAGLVVIHLGLLVAWRVRSRPLPEDRIA
jgi:hypothetical protein